MKKLLTLTAITSLFVASQANAITWKFNKQSDLEAASITQVDTTGTYTATATAKWWGIASLFTGTGFDANVIRKNKGLGVKNHSIDSSRVDDVGRIDVLFIDLGSVFDVYKFTFGSLDGGDDIVINLDGNNIYDGKPVYNPLVISSVEGQFLNFHPKVGSGSDEFYLKSISANVVPDTGSTLALFGLALLGLVGVRRRFAK